MAGNGNTFPDYLAAVNLAYTMAAQNEYRKLFHQLDRQNQPSDGHAQSRGLVIGEKIDQHLLEQQSEIEAIIAETGYSEELFRRTNNLPGETADALGALAREKAQKTYKDIDQEAAVRAAAVSNNGKARHAAKKNKSQSEQRAR